MCIRDSILAILLIYLILAAQFESFKDPLIIMLTVPLAIAGALVFMYFGGITMNIFLSLIHILAEDAQKGGEEKLQKIHDKYIKQIDDMLAAKDKEIMTV